MKAKLFESKMTKEIRLTNGVQFFCIPDESKESFIERVTGIVDRDYVDTLEIEEEITSDKFKKVATKTLQKQMASKTGVELRIIQEVLVERGALEIHPSEGGSISNNTLTDEDIPAEGTTSGEDFETDKPEEGKTEGQKEEGAETPKTDEKKELKKQLSDKDALAKLDEAMKNKGKKVNFLCTKTKEKTDGIVKGVRLDKRNNFIQYRIEVTEGTPEAPVKVMYGKGIDSEDLVFSEAPVEETAK